MQYVVRTRSFSSLPQWWRWLLSGTGHALAESILAVTAAAAVSAQPIENPSHWDIAFGGALVSDYN